MASQDNIKCTVANCRYWKSNKCHASSIEVNVDNGGTNASDSTSTQCHTFEQT